MPSRKHILALTKFLLWTLVQHAIPLAATYFALAFTLYLAASRAANTQIHTLLIHATALSGTSAAFIILGALCMRLNRKDFVHYWRAIHILVLLVWWSVQDDFATGFMSQDRLSSTSNKGYIALSALLLVIFAVDMIYIMATTGAEGRTRGRVRPGNNIIMDIIRTIHRPRQHQASKELTKVEAGSLSPLSDTYLPEYFSRGDLNSEKHPVLHSPMEVGILDLEAETDSDAGTERHPLLVDDSDNV